MRSSISLVPAKVGSSTVLPAFKTACNTALASIAGALAHFAQEENATLNGATRVCNQNDRENTSLLNRCLWLLRIKT
jgi:hypothetical protein